MSDSFFQDLDDSRKGYGQYRTRRSSYENARNTLSERLLKELFEDIKKPLGSDFDDFLRAMGLDPAKPKAAPPKTTNPKARLAEIDKELDIIKGRVPTPKGYSVTPAHVKQLLQERKEVTERVGTN